MEGRAYRQLFLVVLCLVLVGGAGTASPVRGAALHSALSSGADRKQYEGQVIRVAVVIMKIRGYRAPPSMATVEQVFTSPTRVSVGTNPPSYGETSVETSLQSNGIATHFAFAGPFQFTSPAVPSHSCGSRMARAEYATALSKDAALAHFNDIIFVNSVQPACRYSASRVYVQTLKKSLFMIHRLDAARTPKHDIGHMFGANHSGSFAFFPNPYSFNNKSIEAELPSPYQYGNGDSLMGTGLGDFDAISKAVLGYLNWNTQALVVRTSGVYTIQKRESNVPGNHILRVARRAIVPGLYRGNPKEEFDLEYETRTGEDADAGHQQVNVLLWDGKMRRNPAHLVDMTWLVARLTPDEPTFADPQSHLSLTLEGEGTDTADVRITFTGH